jgi:catechol 2,3-dioxygenase-like lactoylglutathione lyase family enzyme
MTDREKPLSFDRFDHVQLAMPRGEEDRARSYYVGVLAMEEVAKPALLSSRGGCWFRRDGVEIHLGVEDGFKASSKAHPAIVVANLMELCDQLSARGIDFTPDSAVPGVNRIHTRDPFGNRIEFMELAAET